MNSDIPPSKIGCSGYAYIVFTLLVVVGSLWLISETFSRTSYPSNVWPFWTTAGIPLAYGVGLCIGRRQLKAAAPDPVPEHPIPDVAKSTQIDQIERLSLFLLIILALTAFGTIGWLVFIDTASSLTVHQLQIWTFLAGIGMFLAGGWGYGLGTVYMENRRLHILAGMGPLLLIFLMLSLWWLFEHYHQLSQAFWIGLPLGGMSILVIWGHLSEGWDPIRLEWKGSLLDWCLWRCSCLLYIIMVVTVFMLEMLLQSTDWLLSSLFPCLLFVFSYMTIKTWWYRPKLSSKED
ncbi:MAG: hypothetical protein AAGF95_30105 [Chloroflexota bacterium]